MFSEVVRRVLAPKQDSSPSSKAPGGGVIVAGRLAYPLKTPTRTLRAVAAKKMSPREHRHSRSSGRWIWQTENALCLAMCEREDLAPNNERKIDGKQEKLRFNGVPVLWGWIGQVVRNWIDNERRGEKKPTARAPRERKE